MNREEAKELLPVIEAYAEGKAIQYRAIDGGYWYDVEDGKDVELDRYDFRIKPEVKYRPFKDVEECWNEMLKHQPFGWVIGTLGEYASIDFLDEFGTSRNGSATWDFRKLFNEVTFADGTPFGIKEGGEE